MKITLTCPTNRHGRSMSRGIYYPMGILMLGSEIKRCHPNYEVSVLDGEIKDRYELEKRIQGSDVLGLSANTTNYPNCLSLAQHAKNVGVPYVILGGPHPTAPRMAELVLKNRPEIDAVIVNDGEEPFQQYIRAISERKPSLESITNLVWRDGNTIRSNRRVIPTQPPSFDAMNFGLIDLTAYWPEHKKEYPAMSERFVEGFTHVGCAWRTKLGCTFCDIPYPKNVYQPPERFWREVRKLRSELGVQSIKDYGDCFTGSPESVRALLEARPQDLKDIEFSLYGKPNEVTEDMAHLLKDLNVRYVYLGFDSGDPGMLKAMRKGQTVDQNYYATERLARYGINVTGSLILGAKGESEETIDNTARFARRIVTYPNVAQLHCSMMQIFPGAPQFECLVQAYPDIHNDDVLDTEYVKCLWTERFCNVSAEYIESRAREINALNPSARKRYFGFEPENQEVKNRAN